MRTVSFFIEHIGSQAAFLDPGPRENNRVQMLPGKGWNTILRIYGPLEPWFNKTWRPGEIELMK